MGKLRHRSNIPTGMQQKGKERWCQLIVFSMLHKACSRWAQRTINSVLLTFLSLFCCLPWIPQPSPYHSSLSSLLAWSRIRKNKTCIPLGERRPEKNNEVLLSFKPFSLSLFIWNYFCSCVFSSWRKSALIRIPSSKTAQDEASPSGLGWIQKGPALCTGQSRELRFWEG